MMIYHNNDLNKLVNVEFGMSADELYELGLALAGMFLNGPAASYPVPNLLNDVDQTVVDRFLQRFTLPLDQHRKMAIDSQSYDINWGV
jgi:hypothetical protein